MRPTRAPRFGGPSQPVQLVVSVGLTHAQSWKRNALRLQVPVISGGTRSDSISRAWIESQRQRAIHPRGHLEIGGLRPVVPGDRLRELICQMARENQNWGEEQIDNELVSDDNGSSLVEATEK